MLIPSPVLAIDLLCLQVAIGTDTGGSIRYPAGKAGVYGFRPSFGEIPLNGILKEGPLFDTVGWITRDPALLRDFGMAFMDFGAGVDDGRDDRMEQDYMKVKVSVPTSPPDRPNGLGL